jgi:HD-like signal output (HDOD) protein
MSETLLAKIPAFPPVVLKALDLLSNDDVQVAELVGLIDSDAVFSSQVLRVANSPMFGFRNQIESVQRAVVSLGLTRIQALTMSVATANYLKATLKTEELHRCWRHTLASAIICRELARACSIEEDRAYTAGLLHDIGRLGLLVAYPSEYSALLRAADRVQEALLDQEKQLFGMDHCEAGRCLVEKWGLPPEFRLITGRHHDQPSGESSPLLKNTYLGCQLAELLGFSVATPIRMPSFESLLEMLPTSARSSFPGEAQALRALVEDAIASHDLAVFSVKDKAAASTGRQSEVTAEPPSQTTSPQLRQSEVTMFAGLPTRSIVWDLTLVTVTVLIFVGVFAALSLLWRS